MLQFVYNFDFSKVQLGNNMRFLLTRPVYLLCDSEVSANLYCNTRKSLLGRLRDYLRLLMGHTL